jgi:hypothetical protein
MKAVALRAIEYAQSAIKVCIENTEYRLGLRYGTFPLFLELTYRYSLFHSHSIQPYVCRICWSLFAPLDKIISTGLRCARDDRDGPPVGTSFGRG